MPDFLRMISREEVDDTSDTDDAATLVPLAPLLRNPPPLPSPTRHPLSPRVRYYPSNLPTAPIAPDAPTAPDAPDAPRPSHRMLARTRAMNELIEVMTDHIESLHTAQQETQATTPPPPPPLVKCTEKEELVASYIDHLLDTNTAPTWRAFLETFRCPFTLETVRQPVVAPDGLLYEEAHLLAYVERHMATPQVIMRSPQTRLSMMITAGDMRNKLLLGDFRVEVMKRQLRAWVESYLGVVGTEAEAQMASALSPD